MKVKVLARSEDEFTRERRQDLQKVFRNLDPSLHPQGRGREYVRASNAVKLERVFAKPFMGALHGHSDSVACMAKGSRQLNTLISGSMDGEIRLWDVAYKRTVREFPGHIGAVRGLSFSTDGARFVSCGDDCTVRIWQFAHTMVGDASSDVVDVEQPIATFQGKNSFRAVDHQWDTSIFATGGAQVDIWDERRSEPVKTFSWGADSVISVRFNPAEREVFATTASDRSIALYDLRMGTALRKLVMQTRTNMVAWNPQEPFNFSAANEDGNCYTYDMRKLKYSTCVHKGHVSAVLDIDYAPTGREFVTGSYDRTVRLFAYNGGHSREAYHTKRMQRVFCVKYSSDATYVLSGSDDTNIRLWKANASEQQGVLLPREKQKQAYLTAVKERYKHLPDIKRIDRHRHMPKAIYKAGKLRHNVQDAERKRETRKRAHSAPGSIPHTPARKKRIVAELGTKAAKALEIVANPTPFNKELLQRLTKLKDPYKPFPFIKNRHVETIFAAFFRSLPTVKYRREYLRMEDGGTVALDWPIDGTDPEMWRTELSESAPVIVMLPGLTGGSGDSYVRHMLLRLRRQGWRPAVFNSRGCGDSPVTSPQFYSASFTEDLRQVVKHVHARFPTSRLYGIGWSLGGNILINYLGQEGQQCLLSGAASLCNPFNLTISNEDFRKGFNNVYDRSLGRGLRKIYQKHAALFEGIGGEYNIDLVSKGKTVWDFDEGLTRVSFGYRSVEEYYADASSARAVRNVNIPVLCIQAADDPIAPIRAVPRAEIEANSNFVLVITPTGGHLGWIAGEDAPFGCPWTDPVVMDYLETLEDTCKDKVAFDKGLDGSKLECYKVEERVAGSERTRPTEPLVSY